MATTLQDTLWGCVTELEYAGKAGQRYSCNCDRFARFVHGCYSYKQSHKITQLSIQQNARWLRAYMDAGINSGMCRRIN